MCLPCQIVDRSKYPIPQLSFPWNYDLSDWTHSINLSAQPFVIVLLCILFFSFRVQQILTLDSNLFSPTLSWVTRKHKCPTMVSCLVALALLIFKGCSIIFALNKQLVFHARQKFGRYVSMFLIPNSTVLKLFPLNWGPSKLNDIVLSSFELWNYVNVGWPSEEIIESLLCTCLRMLFTWNLS
jgi:hypothetical protein